MTPELVKIKALDLAIAPAAIGAVKVVSSEKKNRFIKRDDRTADPILVVETETVISADLFVASEFADIISTRDSNDKEPPATLIVPVAIDSGVSHREEKSFFGSEEYAAIINSYETLLAERREELAGLKPRSPKVTTLTEEVDSLAKTIKIIKSAPARLSGYLTNIEMANSQKSFMIPSTTTHTFTPVIEDDEDDPTYTTNPMAEKIQMFNKQIEENTARYDNRIDFFQEELDNLTFDEDVASTSLTSTKQVNGKVYSIETVLRTLFE